jgi:hypothetical protein
MAWPFLNVERVDPSAAFGLLISFAVVYVISFASFRFASRDAREFFAHFVLPLFDGPLLLIVLNRIFKVTAIFHIIGPPANLTPPPQAVSCTYSPARATFFLDSSLTRVPRGQVPSHPPTFFLAFKFSRMYSFNFENRHPPSAISQRTALWQIAFIRAISGASYFMTRLFGTMG